MMGSGGRIFIGSFPSEIRPEYISRETLNIVLKYADNDNLVIDAQSISQRMLDLYRRGHNVEDILRGVRLALETGLKANVDFNLRLAGRNAIGKTIQAIGGKWPGIVYGNWQGKGKWQTRLHAT